MFTITATTADHKLTFRAPTPSAALATVYIFQGSGMSTIEVKGDDGVPVDLDELERLCRK